MPESLQRVLAEAKEGRFSSITSLTDDDVANVWENVASYVEKQMSAQKGVHIPNFGTFSFSQRKLDVGNNKYVLMQRPVFNISEKFAQTHGLQFTRYIVPGHIPSPPLNFSSLSFESPFDRDTVETCVREIVGSVSRAIAAKKNVELFFSGIGRLQIRDSRVKMRFYKTFINQMDGSGDLVSTMQNRAGTSDSVISDRPFSRPASSNTLLLPKIRPGPGLGSNNLPPLAEMDENLNNQSQQQTSFEANIEQHEPDKLAEAEAPVSQQEMEQQIGNQAVRSEIFADNTMGDFVTEHALSNILRFATVDNEPINMSNNSTDNNAFERKAAYPGPSRIEMPVAKASGISLPDDLIPSCNNPKYSPSPPEEPRSFGGLRPLALQQRSHSAEDLLRSKPNPKPLTPPGSSCGHPVAGQELCYLCHQRARRNIPVCFAEERRRREEEEDKFLLQYRVMKDAEEILKEQESDLSRRHDQQKISAFNLGVSEAVNARKRAKDYDPQRSYIFQRRPPTPPKSLKQEEYLKQLSEQVGAKEASQARKIADEHFLERLEQVQLAEDLAAQREQFMKDKVDQMTTYKNALDAQLRYKPVPLPVPPREPNSEIFGKNDMSHEKLVERRRRAQLLLQDQQEQMGQRKREAILKHLAEQEYEQLALKNAKESLLEDRAYRYKIRVENRRRLEDDWRKASEMKRGRDLESRLLDLESGLLLHEQCDAYHRCQQCKRRLENCGESNVWRDTRFVPGARIMV